MKSPLGDTGPAPGAAGCLSVCVLASGSKGNAVWVSDGTTRILIDAGFSGKEIEKRLLARNLAPEQLDAIVVSHEHSDHIRGVGVLSRRYRLPVHITQATQQAAASQLGKLHQIKYFTCGSAFCIGALTVHPFSTSHDAADSAGFTVSRDGAKIGIATDLGVATGMVRQHLKGCRLLVLEANHDPEMLISGPYPWPLKQRIKGRSGHLANDDSRQLLAEILHDGLLHVVLAHLSETNNTPEKALHAVGPALEQARATLHVACQQDPGPVICLDSAVRL